MSYSILWPVFVQIGLTLAVLLRLATLRVWHIKKVGFETVVKNGFPLKAEQASANFKHQFETPVLFYVIALIFAFGLKTTPLVLALAWLYVGLRILHALIQLTKDVIFPWRFGIFSLSIFVLVILYGLAISQLLGA